MRLLTRLIRISLHICSHGYTSLSKPNIYIYIYICQSRLEHSFSTRILFTLSWAWQLKSYTRPISTHLSLFSATLAIIDVSNLFKTISTVQYAFQLIFYLRTYLLFQEIHHAGYEMINLAVKHLQA